MTKRIWTIGFDADDTLWHNERDFAATFAAFAQMMAPFATADTLQAALTQAEHRNLPIYGFGVKGYILSTIETAVEVSKGAVSGDIIAQLLSLGRHMLAEPVEILDGVRDAIEAVKPVANIIVITKGDLIDQDRKLAQSGLRNLFDDVKIVTDKTVDTYTHIFSQHDTAHHMMVGNSVRSDVIPAIDAGAWGVHVPHELTWDYEHSEPPVNHRRFRQISSLALLPDLISTLS